MTRIITIVLNDQDPGFVYEMEDHLPVLRFNLDPTDMHFHFGPGVENLADLTQKVNFLISKTP